MATHVIYTLFIKTCNRDTDTTTESKIKQKNTDFLLPAQQRCKYLVFDRHGEAETRGNESERQIRNLSQQLEVAGLSSSREEMEMANILPISSRKAWEEATRRCRRAFQLAT